METVASEQIRVILTTFTNLAYYNFAQKGKNNQSKRQMLAPSLTVYL